jgi:hypothetical protein
VRGGAFQNRDGRDKPGHDGREVQDGCAPQDEAAAG